MTIEKLKSDAFVSTDYKRFYTKTISGIEFDPEEFINKTNELIDAVNYLTGFAEINSKDKESEPLPCPFCGEKPSENNKQLSKNIIQYEITCIYPNCDVNPNVVSTLDRNRALQKWNRRG